MHGHFDPEREYFHVASRLNTRQIAHLDAELREVLFKWERIGIETASHPMQDGMEYK